MRMLKLMSGVTRKDRIWNNLIKDKVEIAQISSKTLKKRLNWSANAMRRNKNYLGRRVITMELKRRRRKERSKFIQKKAIKQYQVKGLRKNRATDKKRRKGQTRNSDLI